MLVIFDTTAVDGYFHEINFIINRSTLLIGRIVKQAHTVQVLLFPNFEQVKEIEKYFALQFAVFRMINIVKLNGGGACKI